MRLDCPSCASAFEVNPSALEPNGRTVRCAQCRTTWYVPAPRHSLVMADGSDAESSAAPVPEISTEDRLNHEVSAAEEPKPKIVKWEDAEVVVANGPSISPGRPAQARSPRRIASVSSGSGKLRISPLAACALLLAITLTLGIAARQSVVRAAPETASLFAAIGLPVNLRGLEFQNVKTMREIQDGISVLAIEGEVENISTRAVELPRVRLSVLSENGAEIYSWTALLPRSILYPRERVPFRSRLASPPAAGTEIMVRFLNRADLTAGLR